MTDGQYPPVMPPSSDVGAGHAEALVLKQVPTCVSQQPRPPEPPHAVVQSESAVHFVDVQSGAAAGGGFVAAPVPDGAGSVAGADCVGCVSGGVSSEDAHARMSEPVRARATAAERVACFMGSGHSTGANA
jgi:hypothetical protein